MSDDDTTQDTKKKVKTTDLSDLDTMELGEQGVEMPLRHPRDFTTLMHGDPPRKQTITVASADSDKFQKASRAARDRRNQVGGRRGGPGTVRAAEIDNDSVEMLVAVVIGWDITLNGETPTCAPAAVRKLYLSYPWIMRQVDSFIADDANFLKPSAND
jgi:hypothetical protein